MQRKTALENRKKLEAALAQKMATRQEDNTYHRSRFMPKNFLFDKDEVILHVTGTATSYSIFIEDYEHKVNHYYFDFSNTPINASLQNTSFSVTNSWLTIARAKELFHSHDHYYFGTCLASKKLNDFIENLRRLTVTPPEFIKKINATFATLLQSDSTSSNELSLFDHATRVDIDKKNKYGQWLAKWETRPIKDFSAIENKDARKVLQLLKSYLGGGRAKRVFAGRWHHHYCDEIEALLTPYLALKPLEGEDAIDRKKNRERSTISEMLDISALNESLSLQNREKVTVREILLELKNKIAFNELSELKLHGDLYALLQVIYDKTPEKVNYFELDVLPVFTAKFS